MCYMSSMLYNFFLYNFNMLVVCLSDMKLQETRTYAGPDAQSLEVCSFAFQSSLAVLVFLGCCSVFNTNSQVTRQVKYWRYLFDTF